jgi:putative hydrolase of the HAD superfamily
MNDRCEPRRTVVPPLVAAAGCDAVLFDAGGVLLLSSERRFRFATRVLGVPYKPGAGARAVAGTVAIGSQTADPASFWASDAKMRTLAEALGVEHDAAHILWDLLTSHRSGLQPLWGVANPEVHPVLTRLRQRGVRTGVVSNSNGTLAKLLRDVGLWHLLDVVLDSSEVGLSKPDPEIFRLAAASLGVRISRTAFVGDDPYFDVQASLAAGVRFAILLDPYFLWPEYPDRNVYVVRSLATVLES